MSVRKFEGKTLAKMTTKRSL